MSVTVEEAKEDDVLELVEAWSFAKRKENKQWLWTAMCRRMRQIVAFAIGDRSAKTCTRLLAKSLEGYKSCRSFSDFWKAPVAEPRSPRSALRRSTDHTDLLMKIL